MLRLPPKNTDDSSTLGLSTAKRKKNFTRKPLLSLLSGFPSEKRCSEEKSLLEEIHEKKQENAEPEQPPFPKTFVSEHIRLHKRIVFAFQKRRMNESFSALLNVQEASVSFSHDIFFWKDLSPSDPEDVFSVPLPPELSFKIASKPFVPAYPKTIIETAIKDRQNDSDRLSVF